MKKLQKTGGIYDAIPFETDPNISCDDVINLMEKEQKRTDLPENDKYKLLKEMQNRLMGFIFQHANAPYMPDVVLGIELDEYLSYYLVDRYIRETTEPGIPLLHPKYNYLANTFSGAPWRTLFIEGIYDKYFIGYIDAINEINCRVVPRNDYEALNCISDKYEAGYKIVIPMFWGPGETNIYHVYDKVANTVCQYWDPSTRAPIPIYAYLKAPVHTDGCYECN